MSCPGWKYANHNHKQRDRHTDRQRERYFFTSCARTHVLTPVLALWWFFERRNQLAMQTHACSRFQWVTLVLIVYVCVNLGREEIGYSSHDPNSLGIPARFDSQHFFILLLLVVLLFPDNELPAGLGWASWLEKAAAWFSEGFDHQSFFSCLPVAFPPSCSSSNSMYTWRKNPSEIKAPAAA